MAWRAHVREILAHDLPSAASLGREPWSGLLLKFTAMWSGEMKRVSAATVPSAYSWRRALLARAAQLAGRSRRRADIPL